MLGAALVLLTSTLAPQEVSHEPASDGHGVRVRAETWIAADGDVLRSRIESALDGVHGVASDVAWPIRDERGAQPSGFDSLAFALERAHARGLALHAVVDARVAEEPTFHERADRLRLLVDDLVARYPVDGVQLVALVDIAPTKPDDAIGTSRFTGRGNPECLEWSEWRIAQVEQILDEIAVTVRARRAHCLISVASSSGEISATQRRWLRRGSVDRVWIAREGVDEVVAEERDVGGDVLATVVGDDGAPLVDAWVTLRSDSERRARPVRTSSVDGHVAFAGVPAGKARVSVSYPGAEPSSAEVRVEAGSVSRVELTVAGAERARELPFLDIVRAPERTSDAVAHLLGRTDPSYRVRVGGREVDVFATGLFAADDVPLELGDNRVEVSAEAPDGRSRALLLTITRSEPEASETRRDLVIESPESPCELRPGDLVELRVEGPPGLEARATFGSRSVPLLESSDGTYRGATRATHADGPSAVVRVELRDENDAVIAEAATSAVEIRAPGTVRIARVTAEAAGITHGRHDVRLGGPWLTHVPRGTRLEVVGSEGGAYRVRLTPTRSGFVSARDLEVLPEGAPPPRTWFTSCSVSGDGENDRVTIPLDAQIPFAVRAAVEPNRIEIDLFGTHHALTWISHRTTAEILGDLRAEQVEDEHVRLTIPVRSRQIWGYWFERSEGALTVHVRRPPPQPDPTSVWSGLRIALEPGHGGRNRGAVGAFGTQEKTVNAAAVDALRDELLERGAEVVVVREGDENVGLDERARRAAEAGAHFFVSVHANSAGTSRGFLRVSGTSTYYHEPHCHRAAELVYREMLGLGWDEFGCVGNFSYLPIRRSRVPGILVEQAFVSNPADEARLLDPRYRRAQAAAIADGLSAFFSDTR